MTDNVFCPECLALSGYSIVNRTETLPVKGEDVIVDARVAVCGTCGQDIGDEVLDDQTLCKAYAIYRARHDLLQPKQIKALRSKYGLGQKAFARLLGWGDVTLARYEAGSLQSSSHDMALRLAEDPANVRRLFLRNSGRLTDEQQSTLSARLNQLSTEHESVLMREEAALYGSQPAVRKLGEMMVLFAEQPSMWRTKLNKVLFYADFLHAKRYGVSISGARYLHMQFGPVPADFYGVQAVLVDGASLSEIASETRDCSGTVFVACRPADRSVFSDAELATLAHVSKYFSEWSVTRIMEFSHKEPGWIDTTDRETIPIEYAERLQLS